MKRFEEYRALVEEGLKAALPGKNAYNARLVEACAYALLAPGKRLRPSLLLAAADWAGAALDKALPFAVALECIHAYSLIHDDLPCIDNDVLRRGRPTCHVAFGEPMALLAGDALLNLAFEQLAKGLRQNGGAAGAVDAFAVIAEAAGIEGMVGGQAVDVACEKGGDLPAPAEDTLAFIQRGKTAALFRAAASGGVCLGSADAAARAAFSAYGEHLGIAFQIADDILDASATAERLGKTPGKDAAEGKLTAVSVFGMEGAKEALERETALAQNALASLPGTDFFTAYAQTLLTRDR